ncbi:MAG TPA: hypothetical protein VID47_10620 [Actinomycetota bacterium]
MSLPIPPEFTPARDPESAAWFISSLSPWDRPHALVGTFVPFGFRSYARIGHDPSSPGELPSGQAEVLIEVLGRHTASERGILLVWDGWGGWGTGISLSPLGNADDREARMMEEERRSRLALREFERVPRAVIPGREYVILEGPLSRMPHFGLAGWERWPSAWWPHDRAWVVVTEIDSNSTYVGGSREVSAEILASRRLGAVPADLADPIE